MRLSNVVVGQIWSRWNTVGENSVGEICVDDFNGAVTVLQDDTLGGDVLENQGQCSVGATVS